MHFRKFSHLIKEVIASFNIVPLGVIIEFFALFLYVFLILDSIRNWKWIFRVISVVATYPEVSDNAILNIP